jgi:hypothetical protein
LIDRGRINPGDLKPEGTLKKARLDDRHFLLAGVSFFLTACLPTTSTSSAVHGSWISPCSPFGSNTSVFITTTAAISNGKMVDTVRAYQDPGCKTLSSTTTISGDITNGETVIANGSGNKINYTISSVSLTPNSPSASSAYNANSYCGFSNWESGTPKDVTGNCNYPARGTVQFNLLKTKGNELSFGDPATGSATSEATRPTLFSNIVYLKQ